MKRLLLILAIALLPIVAHAQQLWFAAGDDLMVNGRVGHPHFAELFQPNAPWPTGLAHVNVFQFRVAFFARTPTAELQSILGFLKSHNIKIAVATSVLPVEGCGQGTEGLTSLRQIKAYARILAARGVNVSYFVMDEPLFYGHDYNGRNACHLPVSAVADGVAEGVKAIREYFPEAQFVWVEPQHGLRGGPAELNEFLMQYRSRVGRFPAFVRFDLQWKGNLQDQILPFLAVIKSHHIGFSVIYDAAGAPRNDKLWVGSAKANVQNFRRLIGREPDQVVIQSWNANPTGNLPEDDPNTMTGFLKWYIKNMR